MSYPVNSETFFDSDVRALRNDGNEVKVFSYFKGHKKGDVTYASSIVGFFWLIKHFKLFFKTIKWILKEERLLSIELIKAFALLPKSFSLYRHVIKSSPDIVHLFWGHYPSILGYIISESSSKSQLTMFLGAYDLELKLGVSSSLGNKLNRVFTHTSFNEKLIKDLCGSFCEVQVIHRGVDLELLSSLPSTEKEGCMWLTAGRLIDTKKFDRVIELFYQYRRSNSNAKLTIVGEGPHRVNLEEYVERLGLSDSVNFTGFIEQIELFNYMARSTHFVFLSEKVGERLPNVVKEAMFYENFCIVSNTPGIDELIEDGKEGIVVCDSKLAITRINELEPYAKTIGKCAKEKIESSFNSRVQMKKYISAWKG